MRHSVILVLVLGGMFAGCGGDSGKAPAKGFQLVDYDRERLREVTAVDVLTGVEGRAFQRIFGGTSGTQIDQFVGNHVKHVINADEDLSKFFNARVSGLEKSSDEDRKRVVAANMGAAVWLQKYTTSSSLYGRSIDFISRRGQRTPLTSPALGIVQLGDLYAREVEASDDRSKKVELPSLFRVGILIHEGKHSDCANPDEVVQASRRADLAGRYSTLECAHPHGACPAGHELAGVAACDTAEDRMGPYLIETLFLAAVENLESLTQRERNFIRAQRMDAQTRVTSGYFNVMSRALGETRAPATPRPAR